MVSAELQPPASPGAAVPGLVIRTGQDGSFSLWSEAFGEGFHSGRGALREARETFLIPSELERFRPGSTIRVLEVCAGTGSNLAALLEACGAMGLGLDWTGLELDPEPLALALSQPAFRAPWQPGTLAILRELLEHAGPLQPACASSVGAGTADGVVVSSRVRMLWGDARHSLAQLRRQGCAPLDLIWHDAFSPQRCPQLWSVEFLTGLSSLLAPDGRWLSYCSAAAVREALRLAGLQLAALPSPAHSGSVQPLWSGGTLACRAPLPHSPLWRPLSPMELDHLACSAGEPYRDPDGSASGGQILAARGQAQAAALASGRRSASSAWRRRWRLQP